MIKLNLQFFGGRGSAAGKRSGASSAAESRGTGSAVTTSSSIKSIENGDFNREFSKKDLNVGTERDRYGDLAAASNSVWNYTIELERTLQPGDVVTITKSFKDGTQASANFKISKVEPVFEGSEFNNIEAKRTGSLTFGMNDWGKDHKSFSHYIMSTYIEANRAKVKSVKVDVKRKKSK